VRDVLFVEDMLSLLDVQIAQITRFRGDVFNLGGGAANAGSLQEATKPMQEISARSTSITVSDQPRKGDIALYWTDNRKAASQLGWKPQTDLRTGFQQIFEWIGENEKELRARYAP
jgi:CDP-paratose 2-epimerase